MYFEAGILRIEHGNTENIAREEVGGELDPLKIRADGPRQRFRQCRFSGTGEIFQEHVALG